MIDDDDDVIECIKSASQLETANMPACSTIQINDISDGKSLFLVFGASLGKYDKVCIILSTSEVIKLCYLAATRTA